MARVLQTVLAMAALLAALVAQMTVAQTPTTTSLKMCYVFFGPLNDLGFTFAHNLGRLRAHERLVREFPSVAFSSEYVPGAFFRANKSTTFDEFVRRGCNVIHVAGAGFDDTYPYYVRTFRNITFSALRAFVAPSTEPNLIAYAARSYADWYVAGVVAGHHRRNCTAFLAAHTDVPELIANIDSFAAGMNSVRPGERVHVLSNAAWFNPVKARIAVTALHQQLGCDVIAQYSDSFVTAEYASENEEVFSIPMHGVASRYYGDNVLSCVHSDWTDVYHTIGRRALLGLPPIQTGISAAVSRVCDTSPRASGDTIRAGIAADPNANPFAGFSDSALRGLSALSQPNVFVHPTNPDPSACDLGHIQSYGVDVATGLLQSSCVPCAANTFTTDNIACQPCRGDWTAPPGSAECSPPPPPGLNVGAVVGGVMAGVVVVCLLFGGVIAKQRMLLKETTRDNAAAPQSSPCAVLFTDIQDSTALWQADPDAMATALDMHNAIVRKAIEAHAAYEVKTVGDSFMVAAPDAATCLNIAVDIQRGIANSSWPPELGRDIAVRIGVAHGDVDITFDEVTKGYDYFGPTVNLAARTEASAQGGQVLMETKVAKAAVDDARVAGQCTLGESQLHALKGIEEDVWLANIVIPGVTPKYQAYWKAAATVVDMGGAGSSGSSRGSSRASSQASNHSVDGGDVHLHPAVADGEVTADQLAAMRDALAASYQQLLLRCRKSEAVTLLKSLAKAVGAPARLPSDQALAAKIIAGHALKAGRIEELRHRYSLCAGDAACDVPAVH